jgi:formylglycine-generating enzyme required for sulfatase activity
MQLWGRRLERVPQHGDHDHAGRQAQKEDRLPTEIVAEIAAEGGSDRRCKDHGDRINCKADGMFGARQFGHDDGKGERNQYAACKSLRGSYDNHLAQGLRECASDGQCEE